MTPLVDAEVWWEEHAPRWVPRWFFLEHYRWLFAPRDGTGEPWLAVVWCRLRGHGEVQHGWHYWCGGGAPEDYNYCTRCGEEVP